MRDSMRDGAIGLVVIAAVLALLYSLLGCASGPQVSAPTTPQACSVTLDASDGGSITVSRDIWLDCRGAARADQLGVEASADVQSEIDSTVEAR